MKRKWEEEALFCKNDALWKTVRYCNYNNFATCVRLDRCRRLAASTKDEMMILAPVLRSFSHFLLFVLFVRCNDEKSKNIQHKETGRRELVRSWWTEFRIWGNVIWLWTTDERKKNGCCWTKQKWMPTREYKIDKGKKNTTK